MEPSVTTSNPIDILISHDRWATRQILNACENLTRDEFHRRFPIGPGSLHDTTTHIVGSMKRWVDFLSGKSDSLRIEGPERTVDDIIKLLEIVAAEFASVVHTTPHDTVIAGTHNSRQFTLACGVVVAHVLAHGTHHRAQCINMLRHTGVEPLPQTSVRASIEAGLNR